MDTQNLRAFLLVAESGSFSKAAKRLHLTQPAVSKRIAQLEAQLNVSLFDRIGRRISTTEAGEALLPHARAVHLELQAAQQSVRDLAGEVRGRLRLATSHHIGLHRLPPLLSFFSKAFPAVQLDIDFMDSEQAYELTLQGEVELAVVTLAPSSIVNIVTRPIWLDPLDFMVQEGTQLTRKKALGLKELSQHPAILPGLNTYTGQIVKSLFEQRSLPIQIAITTNYLETIRMMASVGLGWTVLPRSMRDPSLATLPIRDARIERTLGAIHHEGRSLSRAAQAFIEALESFEGSVKD
ncbi:MAG: LysR family transcriptional regulator [Halioglobus sp.]|uniref:LysR family transcriptional regulator n=1 Tax=Halioglobus sp. Uisw_031 TaxID=3230977 RepID=UPI0035915574